MKKLQGGREPQVENRCIVRFQPILVLMITFTNMTNQSNYFLKFILKMYQKIDIKFCF